MFSHNGRLYPQKGAVEERLGWSDANMGVSEREIKSFVVCRENVAPERRRSVMENFGLKVVVVLRSLQRIDTASLRTWSSGFNLLCFQIV